MILTQRYFVLLTNAQNQACILPRRHRLSFWILMVCQNIRLEIAMSTLNITIVVVALFVVRRTFLNECRSLLISVYTQLSSSRYTYINQLVNLVRVEKNVRIWPCSKVIVIPYCSWLVFHKKERNGISIPQCIVLEFPATQIGFWLSIFGNSNEKLHCEIGRAHVWTPVTDQSRMPSSAWKKKKKKRHHIIL